MALIRRTLASLQQELLALGSTGAAVCGAPAVWHVQHALSHAAARDDDAPAPSSEPSAAAVQQPSLAGAPPAPAPAAEPTAQQPDSEWRQLAATPGWLKGPVGRRVLRALGEDEWEAALDPRSHEPCWRNVKTGELTLPGVPKPDTWQQVVDKPTGLLYYWNRRTGETTAIGEPKPGPYGRVGVAQPQQEAQQQQQQGAAAPSPGSAGDASVLDVFGEAQGGRRAKADRRGSSSSDGKDATPPFLGLTQPTGIAFLLFATLAFAVPYFTG